MKEIMDKGKTCLPNLGYGGRNSFYIYLVWIIFKGIQSAYRMICDVSISVHRTKLKINLNECVPNFSVSFSYFPSTARKLYP